MNADEKLSRIRAIVNDGNPDLVTALRELVLFRPEGRYPPTYGFIPRERERGPLLRRRRRVSVLYVPRPGWTGT